MAIPDFLRRGMLIRYGDDLAVVEDFFESKTGQQKPTVHIRLRIVGRGTHVERTLDELGEPEEVPSEIRNAQFLYSSGEEYVFMDTENYEQYILTEDQIADARDFLVPEREYKLLVAEGNAVTLQLPEAVVMTVVDTAPPQHQSSTASNVMKEARLDSGIVIRVPLFIKTGDKVRVSTATREYLGKEKEEKK